MIAVIDGCGANITSVMNSLKKLNAEIVLTTDPKIINSATHVILPGVGHAKSAMQKLKQNNLIDTIKSLKQPLLGICLGMQLLFSESEEGDCECLNIITGKIKTLNEKSGMTLPHMGWNQIVFNNHPLFKDIQNRSYVYFVHNYAAEINQFTLAECEHTEKFSAIVNYKNYFGMQFHPEKSSKVGLQLLKNFLEL